MNSILKPLFVLSAIAVLFLACEDRDDVLQTPSNLKINNFIWKGLNLYYLWQADSPDLADDRFATQSQLNSFLGQYPQPEALFDHLKVSPLLDRFSVLFDDYRVLEGQLQGITKNNGVDYGLRLKSGSNTAVFGWVRYIMPNSDAATKAIQRGDLFYAVNGIPLTTSNYRTLLAQDTYTLNLANFNNGAITPNGQSVTLTKAEYTENPVYFSTVYEIDSKKIGYLVYNGFYSNFETQLNQVFGQFASQGITHLVLDLRYNSGGSVATATRLASMITGQFNGQVFAKQQWNQKVENYYNANDPNALLNKFTTSLGTGAAINSLNLTNLYVLTTRSSASASELLINGLKPYINVVQIGSVTTGKNVGSVTLYDSPTFGKENRNPDHRYAMQPIVLKIVNKNGFGDYQDGLQPTVTWEESLANLGVLGEASEPLLSTALSYIAANGRMMPQQPRQPLFDYLIDSKQMKPFGDEMYLEKVPEGLLRFQN